VRPLPAPTRVLVCEDSATYAWGLTSFLEHQGSIEVVGVCATGEAALEAVARLAPDLVTMDLELPGMGGRQAIEKMMQVHPLPIVVLSAHAGRRTDAAVAVLASGALEALDKGQVNLAALRNPSDPRNPQGRAAGSGEPVMLWIDLAVPVNAKPGDYQTTFEIVERGAVVSTLVVNLKVYDFALSDERHLNLLGGLRGIEVGVRLAGHVRVDGDGVAERGGERRRTGRRGRCAASGEHDQEDHVVEVDARELPPTGDPHEEDDEDVREGCSENDVHQGKTVIERSTVSIRRLPS